jgi:hypothetical protein
MLPIALAALLAALPPAPPPAAAPLQRFTLIVGANSGGADRPQLQYAVSDAERFARVLVDLGGVSPGHAIVLKQPRIKDLIDALDVLNKQVVDARRAPGGPGRTEVLFYYSGHADEQGLLIGADRYSYRTLRDRLDQIPADVRIAILDACASGAFTRLKGGRVRPAFLVDESADMRGHVFLTSSAETEAAQESDRIRASYFTHYLISGFRGAADLSGDGRVTLNEAYQFASNETLRKTVDTKGGAQHPSYDINLSGTGDVVMTDVRQTSATLVLGEDLDGRFFVRNAAHELIVELYKPRGRKVELGVEPGAYEVRIEQAKGSLLAKAQIAEGGRVLLEPRQFGMTAVEATRPRGGAEGARHAVAGRHRLDIQIGMWQASSGATISGTSISASSVSAAGAVSLNYTHYASEDLSITAGVQAGGRVSDASTGPSGTFAGTSTLLAVPIGVRWNPLGSRSRGAVRPFLAAKIGPAIGVTSGAFSGNTSSVFDAHSQTTLFTHVGLGVDYYPARWLVLGVNGGYNLMANFGQPVGAEKNHSGPEMGFTLGLVFGRGRVPAP